MKIRRKRCTAIYGRLTGDAENNLEPNVEYLEFVVNIIGEVTPKKVIGAVKRLYGVSKHVKFLKIASVEDVIYDIPIDEMEKYIVSRKENE